MHNNKRNIIVQQILNGADYILPKTYGNNN